MLVKLYSGNENLRTILLIVQTVQGFAMLMQCEINILHSSFIFTPLIWNKKIDVSIRWTLISEATLMTYRNIKDAEGMSWLYYLGLQTITHTQTPKWHIIHRASYAWWPHYAKRQHLFSWDQGFVQEYQSSLRNTQQASVRQLNMKKSFYLFIFFKMMQSTNLSQLKKGFRRKVLK